MLAKLCFSMTVCHSCDTAATLASPEPLCSTASKIIRRISVGTNAHDTLSFMSQVLGLIFSLLSGEKCVAFAQSWMTGRKGELNRKC